MFDSSAVLLNSPGGGPMVEVGTRTSDNSKKKKIEDILNGIVQENTRNIGGREIYRGHTCEFSPYVESIRENVRKGIGTSPDRLTEPKKHWDPGFQLELVQDVPQHNFTMANRIFSKLLEHTSAGRPVIYITPVGPMGQYPVLADLLNTVRGVDTRLIFPFAMDEWSTPEGTSLASVEYPYMTSFRQDMDEQFYGLLRGSGKIPQSNVSFAADEGLREYTSRMQELLDKGAAVIVTGGVGKIGHIMFWEGTYGVRLEKDLAEEVTWIRGAPLTNQTMDQNETTSSASAPVPAFANTIGLGLITMLRDYGRKNPGLAHAFFGLDNDEEPLKWQRFIAQVALSMEKEDPSLAVSYVPTFPGSFIMVQSHVYRSFNVASK